MKGAVIGGELTRRTQSTGKVIECTFAVILIVSDGGITRFQMLSILICATAGHLFVRYYRL
jgi:hypothetical protein